MLLATRVSATEQGAFGHAEPASHQAQHHILAGIGVPRIHDEHLHGGEDEKAAEDVEDPVIPRDEFRAHADHDSAHDQRPPECPRRAHDAGICWARPRRRKAWR